MKKLMIILTIMMTATTILANPHHNPPRPVQHRPIHHQHHPMSHPHNYWIGPTIIGSAILGSSIIQATTPKTVIVQQPLITQPITTQKMIWIEGHYEDQIINNVLTKVWIPGRYITVNN